MKILGNKRGSKGKKPAALRTIIIVAAIIVALLIALLCIGIHANSTENVFPNTYIGDVDVSGKSPDAVRTLLKSASDEQYDAISFDITVGEITKTLLASDLAVSIDTEAALNMAIERGRGGNAISRTFSYIGALFARETITMPVTLDDELLVHLTEEFKAGNVAPVDAAFEVVEDELVLSPAVNGIALNEENFIATIKNKFATFNYDDVTFELEVAEAKALDMDLVYQDVHAEASDAKLETVDGKSSVTPHVVGIDFDLEAAKKALEATPDKEVRIPLTLTQPKVKTLDIQSTLFQDTLSQKTTYYSPKKVNRVSNVKLAAKYVNGTILNPGEVFSFNKVVGPRTSARGFKEAQIFSAGEVVDGLGGGICQVSSTIYLASMHADLKTVSRRNHSFYVDYAPKGQDATVVYGSIDFQFENNTPYPIKIIASATSSSVTITIKGTKTTNKSVKIKTSTLSTTPYTTKTVVDSSLAPGARVVKQAGQPGMTMEAYRYVYDANGNLISKSFENKTRYVPMTEIVHVGPGNAPAPSTPTSGTTTPGTPSAPTETAPEAPKTEDPKQEEPKVEEPKVEAPSEPTTPAPEEPKTEEPAPTQPEAPSTDTPSSSETEPDRDETTSVPEENTPSAPVDNSEPTI